MYGVLFAPFAFATYVICLLYMYVFLCVSVCCVVVYCFVVCCCYGLCIAEVC